ncbi:hypothetical protein ACF1BE_00095 [Streptomyces sp. NPDC014991]|uniref:hypothetical protein n=1 Tax=Streptomyces sp. NPDC014991 TaxID=3364935 RepID=UPI0037007114
MTAELVRGQNHPLSRVRLETRISAGAPVLAGAPLADEYGRVRGPQWVAHPGVAVPPGVEVSAPAPSPQPLPPPLPLPPRRPLPLPARRSRRGR